MSKPGTMELDAPPSGVARDIELLAAAVHSAVSCVDSSASGSPTYSWSEICDTEAGELRRKSVRVITKVFEESLVEVMGRGGLLGISGARQAFSTVSAAMYGFAVKTFQDDPNSLIKPHDGLLKLVELRAFLDHMAARIKAEADA